MKENINELIKRQGSVFKCDVAAARIYSISQAACIKIKMSNAA
ncbi:hypothetical protein [Paracoccus nototheniae]|uniref:Uncharacterized protein n=1 Tax=Paracoccus nototheniae TaxID=2489002 RepID=A0ABW4DRB6_9RHOB|nr:hypothetical protein [Paracoccus nototheniae]